MLDANGPTLLPRNLDAYLAIRDRTINFLPGDNTQEGVGTPGSLPEGERINHLLDFRV
jgi:hypothetical protein